MVVHLLQWFFSPIYQELVENTASRHLQCCTVKTQTLLHNFAVEAGQHGNKFVSKFSASRTVCHCEEMCDAWTRDRIFVVARKQKKTPQVQMIFMANWENFVLIILQIWSQA